MEDFVIHAEPIEKNEYHVNIEAAIDDFSQLDGEADFEEVIPVLEEVRRGIHAKLRVIVPVEIEEEDAVRMAANADIQDGEGRGDSGDFRYQFRTVSVDESTAGMVFFTDYDEVEAGSPSSTVTMDLEEYLQEVLMNPYVQGLIINPWRNSFAVPKSFIELIFKANLPVRDGENQVFIQTCDITELEVDAIVNAANKSLLGGGGVDGAIHRAAGPALLAECRTLNGCNTGEAKITKGYNLKAKHVIHTVGPVYSGSPKDAKLLRRCYWNSLELARENRLHTIAFPAISTGVYGYPLEEAAEIAIQTVTDWSLVNPHYGLSVVFVGYDDHTTEVYNRLWDDIIARESSRQMADDNDGTLERAIAYAVDHHKGMNAKGSNRPYILHPLEVVQILGAMGADTNLMAAGALHDLIEDTDVTLLDIYERFGVDIAALVNANTEDKRDIWYMRKLHTLDQIELLPIREKMLLLADKLSNLRRMARDYKAVGDELWARFNAPAHLQAWYYGGIDEGVSELQNFYDTEDLYWEYSRLFKDLFVIFLLDEEKGLLYQACADGTNYVLKKGKLDWKPFEGNVGEHVERIDRKYAERIEDNWAEPFWEKHAQDMQDGFYLVYDASDRGIAVDVTDKCVSLQVRNGAAWEEDERGGFAATVRLDADESHRLLVQLRKDYSLRNKLSTILSKEFGRDDALAHFKTYCAAIGIGTDAVPEGN